METFEEFAQLRRGYGQSGIAFGRHYAIGGDAAFHRPGVVSFGALGVHDHANYQMMAGIPELTAVINGYEINTRHIDYRVVLPTTAAYLSTADAVPPSVPAAIANAGTSDEKIAEMREWLTAYQRRDNTHRPYEAACDTYLAVLEAWLENLDGDVLAETFPSFRHRLPSNSHKSVNDDYIAQLTTGLKPRFENLDFKPTSSASWGRMAPRNLPCCATVSARSGWAPMPSIRYTGWSRRLMIRSHVSAEAPTTPPCAETDVDVTASCTRWRMA